MSIETKIVDPDQTAPTGAVWSGFTVFVQYEASNILVDYKNRHFVIMRFKGL